MPSTVSTLPCGGGGGVHSVDLSGLSDLLGLLEPPFSPFPPLSPPLPPLPTLPSPFIPFPVPPTACFEFLSETAVEWFCEEEDEEEEEGSGAARMPGEGINGGLAGNDLFFNQWVACDVDQCGPPDGVWAAGWLLTTGLGGSTYRARALESVVAVSVRGGVVLVWWWVAGVLCRLVVVVVVVLVWSPTGGAVSGFDAEPLEKAEGWSSTRSPSRKDEGEVRDRDTPLEEVGRGKGLMASGLGASSFICFSISASNMGWMGE